MDFRKSAPKRSILRCMTVVSTLLSVGDNDVFKLLQLYGGDPVSALMVGAQIAGSASEQLAAWRKNRSDRRLTLGDAEEAAHKVLAGIVSAEAHLCVLSQGAVLPGSEAGEREAQDEVAPAAVQLGELLDCV